MLLKLEVWNGQGAFEQEQFINNRDGTFVQQPGIRVVSARRQPFRETASDMLATPITSERRTSPPNEFIVTRSSISIDEIRALVRSSTDALRQLLLYTLSLAPKRIWKPSAEGHISRSAFFLDASLELSLLFRLSGLVGRKKKTSTYVTQRRGR